MLERYFNRYNFPIKDFYNGASYFISHRALINSLLNLFTDEPTVTEPYCKTIIDNHDQEILLRGSNDRCYHHHLVTSLANTNIRDIALDKSIAILIKDTYHAQNYVIHNNTNSYYLSPVLDEAVLGVIKNGILVASNNSDRSKLQLIQEQLEAAKKARKDLYEMTKDYHKGISYANILNACAFYYRDTGDSRLALKCKEVEGQIVSSLINSDNAENSINDRMEAIKNDINSLKPYHN